MPCRAVNWYFIRHPPFTTNVKDSQKELIEPAVKGPENVLNSANKTSLVKRVVLTSSCAAIATDTIGRIGDYFVNLYLFNYYHIFLNH